MLPYLVTFFNYFFDFIYKVSFQPQSSQMLQNNPSVSQHGGSSAHFRPLSEAVLLILIYHCSYIP